MRIIQAEYGYSDAEKPLFDMSMMVYFRKRLTPEIIEEINELIIAAEQAKVEKTAEIAVDDKNSGTMSIDATCVPSQISYPHDVSLFNKARECSEKTIDELHEKRQAKDACLSQKCT